MRTLYISQQGCVVGVQQESLRVMWGERELQVVPMPTLEQVLVFGQAQVTTQAIRACLGRDIPIAYLSRLGFCYGRLLSIERGYRGLAQRQQQLSVAWGLGMARLMVQAKLLNGRVLLMRQLRSRPTDSGALVLKSLEHLAGQAVRAESLDQLRGIEGAGAAVYFPELGNCLRQSGFVLLTRTRRPPTNPVNAMLSFGYSVLWNHLLTLIELQDLDPYQGCLHVGSRKHAALVSDLIEEFRSPVVDSLVLWLVNTGVMNADRDFSYHDGGCFLNESGRKKYLKGFVERMTGRVTTDDGEQPRWDLFTQQIRAYKQCVYDPDLTYSPYRIR